MAVTLVSVTVETVVASEIVRFEMTIVDGANVVAAAVVIDLVVTADVAAVSVVIGLRVTGRGAGSLINKRIFYGKFFN